MLEIHPDECIDCGACVPACPANAIFSDAEPQATENWLLLNRQFSEVGPISSQSGSRWRVQTRMAVKESWQSCHLCPL